MSCEIKKNSTFAPGEVAEWSIAAVLKTVEGHTSGGSNPSFSADKCKKRLLGAFLFERINRKFTFELMSENKKDRMRSRRLFTL